MRISYGSFGTLPIGILFSNLGSGQLMTCPRTLFGQIWNMSLFGNSRAVRVFMPKYRGLRKSIFSQWRSGDSFSRLGVLGGQMAGLYGGTIFGAVRDTWGLWQGFESEGSAFRWFFDTFAAAYRVLGIDRFHQASVHRCTPGSSTHFGLHFWICHRLAVSYAVKCQLFEIFGRIEKLAKFWSAGY